MPIHDLGFPSLRRSACDIVQGYVFFRPMPVEEFEQTAWQDGPFVKEQIDNCFLRLTKHMDDSQRKEFKHLLQLASEAVLSEEE